VKVWHDGKVKTSCSCNYSKKGICRHVAATTIAILKRESNEKAESEAGINLYEDGSFVVPQVSSEPISDEEDSDEVLGDPTPLKEQTDLRARDVMASPVSTLQADASIAQAWQFVQGNDVRHVPIVSTDGTIRGVVSDRDLLRDAVADAIAPGAKPLTDRQVVDLVSPRLLTAGPETEIAAIARVLYEEHVGCLPIIDEDKNLVGCGYFAQNHLNAWRELQGVELAAVCDQDVSAATHAADTFGVSAHYRSLDEMLDSESLDFVDIVTQAPTHKSLVEAVAERGVHVICQKPFAPTLAEARDMVIACERSSVKLMIHENFRWQRPFRALKEVLDSGTIGAPFFCRISFRSAQDVYANQPYLATYDWFIIYDLGIHLLDLSRFLMGEVEQLYATTQRVNPSIAAEDVATISMDIEGGRTYVVDTSYASHLEHEAFPQTFIDIEGSLGSVRLSRDYALTVVSEEGVERRCEPPTIRPWSTPPGEAIQDSVVEIQRYWLSCLREDCDPETSGSDNLRTLELVFGAYSSAAERTVYRAEKSLGTW